MVKVNIAEVCIPKVEGKQSLVPPPICLLLPVLSVRLRMPLRWALMETVGSEPVTKVFAVLVGKTDLCQRPVPTGKAGKGDDDEEGVSSSLNKC